MKTVTIYTDGKAGSAALILCPPRSPLTRQPRGDDRQAPSEETYTEKKQQRRTKLL